MTASAAARISKWSSTLVRSLRQAVCPSTGVGTAYSMTAIAYRLVVGKGALKMREWKMQER